MRKTTPDTTKTSAFTLIELLIVVAIIAILAAIAVPNFLEAQVRAKVSRAKADMRSIATALESYAVDYNRYPLPANEDGEIEDPPVTEFVETRISPMLTTPVAYITTIPNEPFAATGSAENPQFHYSTRHYVLALTAGGYGYRAQKGALLPKQNFAPGLDGSDDEWNDYVAHFYPSLEGGGGEWYLLSHGPDLDHDAPHDDHDHAFRKQDHDHEDEEAEAAPYDATNGTKSNGDILLLGPGFGFAN